MYVDETKAYFFTFNFLLNASPHLNHVQIELQERTIQFNSILYVWCTHALNNKIRTDELGCNPQRWNGSRPSKVYAPRYTQQA